MMARPRSCGGDLREHRDGGLAGRYREAAQPQGIPSPRAGTRNKRSGWGAGTIRAILYNERYIGVWRFKERQWVKRRQHKRLPRPRDASEVMTMERLAAIIDARPGRDPPRLTRSASVHGPRRDPRCDAHRTNYLFSGILTCGEWKAHDDQRWLVVSLNYSCATNRTKGTCQQRTLDQGADRSDPHPRCDPRTPHEPDGIAHVRKVVAEYLRTTRGT